MPDISASAKRPRMRSISRVPRCQQRNKSRLRRSSRSPLDRVVPVIFDFPDANAESPDVPGGADIAMGARLVSPRLSPIIDGVLVAGLDPAIASLLMRMERA